MNSSVKFTCKNLGNIRDELCYVIIISINSQVILIYMLILVDFTSWCDTVGISLFAAGGLSSCNLLIDLMNSNGSNFWNNFCSICLFGSYKFMVLNFKN